MGGILCVGHAVQDYIFRVEELPVSAEKHQARGFSTVGGGPAANAAVTIARLGGAVKLAARVGDDAVGETIIAELSNEGVDCALVHKCAEGKSSLSAIAVDDEGRRMIMNYLDPAMPAETGWLEDAMPPGLDAVLVDTRWPEGALVALNVARENNRPAILDADHPIPQDGALVRAATHAAFSAQGLRAFAGMDDLESALNVVSASTDAWCCVTDGENGVFIQDGRQVHHVAAPVVTVVDTLGAGDVWHGAFA